uniref:Putative secreted protein n=1 Tax=Xenopsylla cheopis TaxID=163159 RepID=A0A6M2DDD2_XENCH
MCGHLLLIFYCVLRNYFKLMSFCNFLGLSSKSQSVYILRFCQELCNTSRSHNFYRTIPIYLCAFSNTETIILKCNHIACII